MSAVCDVVIPALNERPNIDGLFDALQPLREQCIRHIVVGDNGSTDGTVEAATARGAIVVHQPRRGYGSACLAAIDHLAGLEEPPEILVFLDADLADDPAAIPSLVEPITSGRAELVIGSRLKYAEAGALNTVQRFGNWLACTMIARAAGRRFSDLGPLRAVSYAAYQQMAMADPTWGWTVEMQMKAALLNIDSEEIDVPYRCRAAGRSKISGTISGVARAGTKIIMTILSLWWQRETIRAKGRSRD